MPQVASEATSAVFRPAPPTALRPAPGSDGIPDLPFESLLDTDMQAAPPPPPQPAQPPQQPPQADPDRTADENSGSKPAKAESKAPDKTVSKPDDKTAGKTDDETADKTTNPIQPLGAEPTVAPKDDEAANSTDNIKVGKASDDSKATQVLVQPAVQPVAQTFDNTKATDATDAIATAVMPAASKSAGDTKAKTNSKLGEVTKDTDTVKATDGAQGPDLKASGDVQPADSSLPVITVTNQTIAPVQSAAPVAVAPATPTPAATLTSAITEISQAAPRQTLTVTGKPTAAPKAKADDFAVLQEGAQKLAAPVHDETPAAASHVSPDKPSTIATDASNALPKTTGDAVQQSSLPAPTPDMAQALAPPTAPAAPAPLAVQAPPVPIAGVAIEIATQAQAGKSHFEIRLDPPELGRIDVQLDVDRDGRVTSRLIADRSDTLNLLRNDAAGLQRALQDAGLKMTDNGLQFSLRDQNMSQQQNAAPSTPNATQIVVQDSLLPAGDVAQRNYSRLADLRGGIDIRV